jgi:hypothetical protein
MVLVVAQRMSEQDASAYRGMIRETCVDEVPFIMKCVNFADQMLERSRPLGSCVTDVSKS